MGLRKKLNFELSPDQEGFLMFVCFLGSGLIGYFLTHFMGLLH
ncbi:MAG: hypothetical protein ABSB10_04255 [Candidatus Bathyarchaeia archaeon]